MLTPEEESELKAIVTERVAAREATRLLNLEHKRMRLGRSGLTAPENTELDAHLADRESRSTTVVVRG